MIIAVPKGGTPHNPAFLQVQPERPKVAADVRNRNISGGSATLRQGGGVRETFVVRKISFGTGVERRFPLHSPAIDSIKVVRKGRVRRAKLYYLRNLRGKAARIVERRDNSEK